MSDNSLIDLEKEDMILLHLNETTSSESESIEKLTSNEEIFKNLDENNLDEQLGNLKDKGMISEIQEEENKCYRLTEDGEKEKKNIWDEIKDEKVILIDDKDTVRLTMRNIDNLHSDKSLIDILKNIDEDKILDVRDESQIYHGLVGREQEIEELMTSVEKMKEESSKAIFIAGDTGIGKTRLVEEVKRLAVEENIDFLKGKCDLEEHEPYHPFKDALDKFLKMDKEIGEFENMITPSHSSEEKVHTKQMFDAQRKSVFYGTTKFFESLCEIRPLVLFLDDLQWADKGTLNLLDYMTDRLQEKPILIFGTYRPGDVSEDDPLKETMRRMSRKKLYEKMELSPLDTSEIEELIKTLTNIEDVPRSFVESIEEKTNGNTLFIKENVNQMIEEKLIDPVEGTFPDQSDIILIPDVVHEVIEKRVYKLDDETRGILQLGSVIGRKVPFELLGEASDMDELEVLEKIDDLLENKIWIEHPREEAFLFTHELFIDTIYDGVGKWVEKKSLHEKVAKAMQKVYEDQLEENYSVIGRHYYKGERYQKSFEYFKKAGEKAEKVYAYEDAIERYKQSLRSFEETEALDDEEVFSLLEKLGEANTVLGNFEEARKYLSRALKKTDDIEKQRRAYRKIADTWSSQGKPEKVIGATKEGLSMRKIERDLPEEEKERESMGLSNSAEICRLLSHRGAALTRLGKYDEAKEIFFEELERAEELDEKSLLAQAYHDLGLMERGEVNPEDCIHYLESAIKIREEMLEEQDSAEERFDLSRSYNNLGVIYLDLRELEKAIPNFKRVLDLNKKTNNKQLKELSLQNLSLIYRYKGELEKSENIIEKLFEIYEIVEDRHGLLLAKNTIGKIALERGNLEHALGYLEDSLEIAEESDIKFRIVEVLTNISETHMWKGDIEEARNHIQRAYELAEEVQNNRAQGMSLYMKGRLDRLAGDVEESIKKHHRGIEISSETDERVDLLNNRCELAEDYLLKGDLNKAKEELNKAKEIGLDTPRFNTWLRMLEGILLRKKGDLERAESKLEESLKEAKEASKIYRVARLNCELGKLMKRKGEDKKAEEYFEKAVGLSDDKGIKLIKDVYCEELNEYTSD